MVTDTDLPLAEIALRTGFASPSSFAHSFRRHVGRSAGELRRAARVGVRADDLAPADPCHSPAGMLASARPQPWRKAR